MDVLGGCCLVCCLIVGIYLIDGCKGGKLVGFCVDGLFWFNFLDRSFFFSFLAFRYLLEYLGDYVSIQIAD